LIHFYKRFFVPTFEQYSIIMNFKLLLLLGLSALATQGAVIKSRQKRTVGIATAALNAAAGLGTAAVGTAAGVAAGAAQVGRSVLIAKPLILGLAGKYALFKYLSNKKRNEGLHIGGSAGFGLGGHNIGGSAGFGIGGQANDFGYSDSVVENVESYPTVSDVTYESVPQVVYDQQPTVVYEQQPTVVYEQQPTVVYDQQPTVQVVQQPAVQVFRQPAVQVVETVQQPAPAFDFDSNIDSYGAPAAPLLF
jgi:hypothetical protein